ncbi:MAG TPA: hypothetical protein ENF52_03385 [Chloroflexi bacterium]|nr:hypothetical protein [Chloroflexota bacterium]
MKLSQRQLEFLGRLLDLYHTTNAPVRYTDVAEALQVKPVTAYEMLRLLEEKGLVVSEMTRPPGRRGRSILLFRPTARASAAVNQLTGGSCDDREWQAVKADLLDRLRQVDIMGDGAQDLLEMLLLRIPERKTPLLFVADMVTVIILVCYQMRDLAASRMALAQLRRFGPPGWAVLYSLAGISLALSLVEKANRRATSLLLSYTRQFQQHLDHLTSGDQVRVSDFVYEVLQTLGL